ncbi:hypothetical protein L7F22_047717 [Adiantum nelumboides]|nr:hypothetical protein [Adiantum nelumboides]
MYLEAVLLPESLFASETKLSKEHHSDSTPSPPLLQCSADLPHSIRMGRVEVGCEGWDHSSDPYILKGSCGLEYTLLKSFDDGQSQSYQSTSCESIIPDSTSQKMLVSLT